MTQQGDVIQYQSVNDGDMEIINGVVTMDGGLQTSVYISLFGGDIRDDGRADNEFKWWGNHLETEPDRFIVSETQNLLQGVPATSSNLLLIKAAVERDLAWMITAKVANDITVTVTIPALNTVKIIVNILAVGIESSFEFVQNWKGSI